ncbi:hypothetical protein [Propionibacterium freudenreichii]|uniref:hypothetical protein n=1 Tax=Propionibacterium freudenreichii TaxID=1744 RepID=UPI00054323DB|nr:hypothetical protein [Propionibacterium freudenreichii]CEG94483.1 Protein of unknown function [Propionibacterium freudenreichii]CEG97216.1 Protein of unknown function [Propionibacterium freudenreichii]CEI23004.1 Protein of unknown function [Propionibacterium freudenreichii]
MDDARGESGSDEAIGGQAKEDGQISTVTGLTVEDFHLLVNLGVFNATHMNQAVFAFRRYEDSSLSYTGIESHKGLRHYGLYDTVVAIDDETTA